MAELSTYILLLRGVNVGGAGKLAMSGLKASLASLGLEDVVTYIQSGNAVFRAPAGNVAKLAASIEQQLAADHGLEITVLLRTPAQLARIRKANPFPGAEAEPSKHHVAFLDRAPTAAAVATLDPNRSPPDEFSVHGAEIYLRYPAGSGRTKLTGAYFEKQLGVRATARNWNTLLKLAELAAE